CMEESYKKNTHKRLREEHRRTKEPKGKTKAAAANCEFKDFDNLIDWQAIKDANKGNEDEIASKTKVEETFCKDCPDTLKCALVPFDGFCCPVADKARNIVSQTPHHVVQAHCFQEVGGRSGNEGEGTPYKHLDNYRHTKAPCVCLDGQGKEKEHGDVHKLADAAEQNAMDYEDTVYKINVDGHKKGDFKERIYKAKTWSFDDANDAGCGAVADTKQNRDCDKECLKKQSEIAHKDMMGDQFKPDMGLRADPYGSVKATPTWKPDVSTTPPGG